MEWVKNCFAKSQAWLPQHLISNVIGLLASSEKPWIARPFIEGFRSYYQVDLSDALHNNSQDYRSFNAFFTRKLKMTARPINQQHKVIVSPCDGKIVEQGRITSGRLISAKHASFLLQDLLGGHEEDSEPFQQGHFITCYLAPKDYHRFHMPCHLEVTHRVFIPGKLFSVNARSVRLISGLFARNERCVVFARTPEGVPIAIVLVGAFIVGSIKTVLEDKVLSSVQGQISRHVYTEPYDFKKGALLGWFQLGSTILLIFPKDSMVCQFDEKATVPIKMGQCIGTWQ